VTVAYRASFPGQRQSPPLEAPAQAWCASSPVSGLYRIPLRSDGNSTSVPCNETGLDHYQVRLYCAWYRHVTLSMLALAFLAITRQKGAQPLWTTSGAGHQNGQ
jgi:hypothetical protein